MVSFRSTYVEQSVRWWIVDVDLPAKKVEAVPWKG